jgi:uncharacterized protein (TIGR03435 family)
MRRHVAEKLYVSRALMLVVGAAIAWRGAMVLAEQRPATAQTVQVQGPPQTPQAASLQDPRERFEVVSIRPSGPDRNLPRGARGGRVRLRLPLGSDCDGDVPQVNPGRIVLNNNVYTLISFAYSLDCLSPNAPALVSGGSEWVKTDQWAIQALTPEAAGLQMSTEKCRSMCRAWISDPRVQRMLQNLLAERFKLVLHWETKEVPVYELTVANGGPKLEHPEDAPCSLPGDSKPDGKPSCTIGLRNGSMANFAASIVVLDRPVIDRTGITGRFDFRLIFEPRLGLIGGLETEPSDPSGPSIFTALQKQLGLKLESAKAPAEVLVIDHLEKPSEN